MEFYRLGLGTEEDVERGFQESGGPRLPFLHGVV